MSGKSVKTKDFLKNQLSLPKEIESWPREERQPGLIAPDQDDDSFDVVKKYTHGKRWLWPGKVVYFFCDLHADADAF